MIDYQKARELLMAETHSFGKERIGLDAADGRVLSENILADRDYPPFDRSSVDGYALRWDDLQQGIRQFDIIGTIYAGGVGAIPVRPGACYKIMTGAPVPNGADTVVRREDTEESTPSVLIGSSPFRPFINISRRGEDMHGGEMVIQGPCVCEPALIGLLASLGKHELVVEKLPRVALFTTGNEVVPVDEEAGPAQIRNSNRWVLQSFLKK
jgi:molybdopterin molybdotransferase